jgi:hypothetical protein
MALGQADHRRHAAAPGPGTRLTRPPVPATRKEKPKGLWNPAHPARQPGTRPPSGAENRHTPQAQASTPRSRKIEAKAYSQLWASANNPASFVSVACAGATTSSVISSQLSALGGATTLVSITVGGNDVGFSSVMETCVLHSTSTCVSAINKAESEMTSTLPSALNSVLNGIAAHAPNAEVVVLGYPGLYDLSKSSTCIGLSTTDRTDLNEAAGILDNQIASAAASHGDPYVDVRPYFAGHEICDSSSWLHSVDLFDLAESYHPTATGQADGYLPAFVAGVAER